MSNTDIDNKNAAAGTTGTGPGDNPENISDKDIQDMQEKITKSISEKKQAASDKKYSQEDFDRMAAALVEKMNAARDSEGNDIIDLLAPNFNQRRFVSVPRMDDKFVVGLENLNTDTYSDKKIYITNVENPNVKTTGTLDHIPFAKFMFEDKSESKLYPYLQFLDKANWVWCEIVDRKETDTSETFGTVEVTETTDDEWNMKGTGQRILSKAKRTHTTYVVRDIKEGHEFEVDEIIINKKIAPVDELKKFLERNK